MNRSRRDLIDHCGVESPRARERSQARARRLAAEPAPREGPTLVAVVIAS
jgi:hypothetical protein